MIEVRKLIPQIYNSSRDFSVFMGGLQVLLNELDQKSKKLEHLPSESLLLGSLSSQTKIREFFRLTLQYKGSLQGLLMSITLSGGELFSFSEEEAELTRLGLDPTYIDRTLKGNGKISESDLIEKELLVYYERIVNGVHELYINLKDLGAIDRGLLTKLSYYLKPVNTVIILKQAKLN